MKMNGKKIIGWLGLTISLIIKTMDIILTHIELTFFDCIEINPYWKFLPWTAWLSLIVFVHLFLGILLSISFKRNWSFTQKLIIISCFEQAFITFFPLLNNISNLLYLIQF